MGHVLAALLGNGKSILVPFGDGLHYDLAIDEDGSIKRVQCKTGKLKKGVIVFRNYTVLRGGGRRSYGSSVDYYGVYCPQNRSTYLVPSVDCATSTTHLRIDPALNNMSKGIRSAEKYLIQVSRMSSSG